MGRPSPTRPDAPLYVALDWIPRHCVVPDSLNRGRPFVPYDFQLRYLAGFYRVRGSAVFDPTRPIAASAFVHRRGLLVDAQKKGKSPLIAAQVCAEGVGPVLFAGWAGPRGALRPSRSSSGPTCGPQHER